MNTQTQIKEIKKTILEGNCYFIIRGVVNYQRLDTGSFGYAPQKFKVNDIVSYIHEANAVGISQQMNIEKITKTAIYLYTYSMLNKRVSGKIKFEDITLIKYESIIKKRAFYSCTSSKKDQCSRQK